MPDFDEFTSLIKPLWESKMLTNGGAFVSMFENEVASFLGEKYVSVYSNGTIPLLAAFKALGLKGEVITTPYTFVATAHALIWSGLMPVFVDVDPTTGNLDPFGIQRAITSRTSAILPVHVYGRPCRTEDIDAIARENGLEVIYDAAHAFGVRRNGESITSAGSISTLSFHATKVFNTLEGGAIVCRDEETKLLVDRFRNFGFKSETEVEAVGINAKMDEMRAAFGILNLRNLPEAIMRRQALAEKYANALSDIKGIELPAFDDADTEYNYSHYPILLPNKAKREDLYASLKSRGIFARRYFYPLVSDFHPYDRCKGAESTPNARLLSDRVLCLPFYPDLIESNFERILSAIRLSIIDNK